MPLRVGVESFVSHHEPSNNINPTDPSEAYSAISMAGKPVFTTVRPIATGIVALKAFPGDSAQPFRIRVRGDSGMTCVIDASTNLVDWMSLSTNAIGIDWLDFIESDTNRFSQKFYRVRTQQ